MSSALTDNQQNQSLKTKTDTTQTVPSKISGGKEKEALGLTSQEVIQEVGAEVEIPEEVEKIVKKVGETMEIPPDVEKMGVTTVPPAQIVATSTTLPTVTLPISDDKVYQGLHAQITDAVKWLAWWCLKQLKKAHLTLKKIHGKIVRVKES